VSGSSLFVAALFSSAVGVFVVVVAAPLSYFCCWLTTVVVRPLRTGVVRLPLRTGVVWPLEDIVVVRPLSICCGVFSLKVFVIAALLATVQT
jgi:hypothetical protein